ncbi:hypothetical protein H5410_030730 [Solanum commersonii]|uniref:Protein FAR1-RELATED SEQUENCE n=1 Tax=Solanum commersonii TaxID=4109 RepID=A0A9J5YI99_SOLCO|nr:hypothetical protein H5410_030730 [Solanum commersonii]
MQVNDREFFYSIEVDNKGRQSILLGCTLLSHEAIISYKLFFRTWLEAMGNVHPCFIITDQ